MRTLITTRVLGTYVVLMAAYQLGAFAWAMLSPGGGPSLLLDPRLGLEWFLVGPFHFLHFDFTDRQLQWLSLPSGAWLLMLGLLLRSSRPPLALYILSEAAMAAPGLILSVSILIGGGGHIMDRWDAAIMLLLLVVFSVLPLWFAIRCWLALHASANIQKLF